MAPARRETSGQPGIDVSKLSVPVGARRRVLDVLCLAAGAVMVWAAVLEGGQSMLLLVPGVGLLAVGVFLLTRRRRLAEARTMVEWFQQALEERYGVGARGREERLERGLVFMQVAAKLAELGAGEPGWAVIGAAGGLAGRVAFVEVVNPPTGKRACLLVPEPPDRPALFLEVLAPEERERAAAAFGRWDEVSPGVWRVDCHDRDEAAAAVERAFSQAFGLGYDYEASCRLCSVQPPWVLGGA
jgi:hypothetical protein